MIRVVSDTAANLSKELIDKLKITIVNFQYFVDGKLQGNDFDGKKYYDSIRNGAETKTSLISVGQFVETFEETCGEGPKACADKLIEKLGVADAKEIIAYMTIAHGDWDARIDDRVYAWATTICPYDKESVNKAHIYYCDDIHPANFDMIAKYIMRSE